MSKSIGLKVMKQRTVKVTLYKVTKQTANQADNTADQTPDAIELQKFLNDIFKPQLNVSFDVKYADSPLSLNWDVPSNPADPASGNGILDSNADDNESISAELDNILGNRPSGRPESNIDVFLLGTDHFINNVAWATTRRTENGNGANACWVVGDALQGRSMTALMRTISHEIGHVFVGYGHRT
ncbi:MAG: hypothetical protein ABI162_02015 [Luteolibacter sp.]